MCPIRSVARAKARRWGARDLRISTPPHPACRAVGGSGSRSPRLWFKIPAILLLDEPTNHLDLAGIEWLEELLRAAPFASVVVSHDRYFLERVVTRMMELSPAYPGGFLSVNAGYSGFLEKKSVFLHAQAKRQEVLENLVRIEIDWLRRGPKARATKAKARIDQANEKIGELADLRSRSKTTSVGIDFAASDRRTKRLVHLEQVAHGFEGRPLISNLDFTITAGMRVGLVGANGSGKTTLLRLLRGEIAPVAGEIERAPALRTVYFDQTRKLDPNVTLRRALAPDSDSVIYQERVIHVACVGGAVFVFERAVESAGGSIVGRGTGARADREI